MAYLVPSGWLPEMKVSGELLVASLADIRASDDLPQHRNQSESE